jgi:hypothetical protein
VALQLHGSGRQSNPTTMSLGARLNAGFFCRARTAPIRNVSFLIPSTSPVRRLLDCYSFWECRCKAKGWNSRSAGTSRL